MNSSYPAQFRPHALISHSTLKLLGFARIIVVGLVGVLNLDIQLPDSHGQVFPWSPLDGVGAAPLRRIRETLQMSLRWVAQDIYARRTPEKLDRSQPDLLSENDLLD